MPQVWEKTKEILGISDSNEFVASAEIAVNDRIASPFYGYFVISWLIINWHYVYIALFLSQEVLFEKTGMMKNEYLYSRLPPTTSLDFYIQFLLLPFLLTVLVFWLFPYGTRIFYRKNLKNKMALKIIELQELRMERGEEKKLAEKETELLETELEKAKVEKKAAKESPEILWEREYFQFKVLQLFKKFNYVIESVYEHGGRVIVHHPYNDDVVTFQVPKDMLAFAHTNNLISFGKTRDTIDLTEKGKLFVRKFTAENN